MSRLVAEGSPVAAVVTGVALGIWVLGGAVYRWRRLRSHGVPVVHEGVDPGWGPALMRMGQPRSPGAADPLTMMRIVFSAFVLIWLTWSFVLTLMVPWSGDDAGPALWLVLGAGVLSLAGVAWVRRRRLNPIDEASLQGQMRTLMFLGLAIAEAPGILGVVAAITRQSLWLSVVGMTFSLVDMALIAPGRREIARRRRQLIEDHSTYDLTHALMARPTPSRPD